MNNLDDTELAREVFNQLAATMPDNPSRAGSVQRLVRRRRNRRVATRASVGLVCAAGVGVVAVSTMSNRAQQVLPASASTDPAASSSTPPTTGSSTANDPCADLEANGGAPVPSADGRFKGTGTVTAVDGDSISIAVRDASIDITDFTATIAADAQYDDANVLSSTRPALAVGDLVGFGAVHRPDGTYVVDSVATHLVDPASPDTTPNPDAARKAQDSGAENADGRFKGSGTVTAINGDSITIAVDNASIDITELTASLTASTEYRDADVVVTPPPSLAIGESIGFGASTGADGSYQLDLVATNQANYAGPDSTSPDVNNSADPAQDKLKQAIAACVAGASS